MKEIIVLDSTPLGSLFHKPGIPEADAVRAWMARLLAQDRRVIVPEIVVYELSRELLRMRNARSMAALRAFIHGAADRYLPITTAAMDRAAEIWAAARQEGFPTADPHALDADVILAAQTLTAGFPNGDFVVATSNLSHLSRFVPAALWSTI